MRNHSVNTPWNEEIISKRCACKSRCFKYRFKSAGTYRTKNGGQSRQGQNAGMGSAGRGGFRRRNGGIGAEAEARRRVLRTQDMGSAAAGKVTEAAEKSAGAANRVGVFWSRLGSGGTGRIERARRNHASGRNGPIGVKKALIYTSCKR